MKVNRQCKHHSEGEEIAYQNNCRCHCRICQG